MQYTKLLVSKESKNNFCYVPDGEILILRSIKNPKEFDTVRFEWHKKLTIKNKYGWVKNVQPFSFEEFISNYCSKIKEIDYQTINIMLNDIKDLPEDTPVAADYSKRGISNSKLILKVHKVFFYKT